MKKIWKILLIFDIENWLWKSDFGTFWQIDTMSIQQIQSFPLGHHWFLAKNISNFVSLSWKHDTWKPTISSWKFLLNSVFLFLYTYWLLILVDFAWIPFKFSQFWYLKIFLCCKKCHLISCFIRWIQLPKFLKNSTLICN